MKKEPALPTWLCEADKKSLTVGEKVILKCSGPETKWNGPVELQAAELPRFSLNKLDVRSQSDQELVLVVTSYRVGAIKGVVGKITDGASEVSVVLPDLEVQSVIQSNPPPKPYPPFGPYGMIIPPIYFFIVAGLLIFPFVMLFIWLFKKHRARVFRAQIKMAKGQGSPILKIHREIRKLDRESAVSFAKGEQSIEESFLAELEKSFREFMWLELELEARRGDPKTLLKRIRKRHPKLFRRHGDEISVTLYELSRARKRKQLNPQDWNQLILMVQNTAEGMARP